MNGIFPNIPSDSLLSFRKKIFLNLFIYLFIYLFENFNISENNMISVELAQVLFVLLILILIFFKRPRPLCTASYILRLTNPGRGS
jgi:hypothetical protein